MKLQVIFKSRTGHLITEIFDPATGCTMDYKLRAMAFNWLIVSVTEID